MSRILILFQMHQHLTWEPQFIKMSEIVVKWSWDTATGCKYKFVKHPMQSYFLRRVAVVTARFLKSAIILMVPKRLVISKGLLLSEITFLGSQAILNSFYFLIHLDLAMLHIWMSVCLGFKNLRSRWHIPARQNCSFLKTYWCLQQHNLHKAV